MSEYRPIERSDYLISDFPTSETSPFSNRLLDDDGCPAPTTSGSSTEGLAALAAVLDRYGPSIKPEYLEKAVWWLKDWKAHNSKWHRSVTAGAEFLQAMESLKQSDEAKADGQRARRLYLVSQLSAVVAGVCIGFAILAWFAAGAWGAKTGWTIAALLAAGWTTGLRDAAKDRWQTQERRHLLECLRLSRCTEDLSEAGLFGFHPQTMGVSSAEEYLAFRRRVRSMQLQLADALYFDWDRFIRERSDEVEQAHGWNWSK